MSSQLITTKEKPLQHIGLADWHCRVNHLRNVASSRRNDAFDLRYASQTLRNESKFEADWSGYETSEALASRISEVNRWNSTIQRTFDRIIHEIKMLREESAETERELELMALPMNVVAECLAIRDSKYGSELTYDDADTELKKEKAVLENNHRLLREQSKAAYDKLLRLEDVEKKIGAALLNQANAEKIDRAQLELTKDSPDISFKPNATRHPKNSYSYASWLLATKNLKQMAENELADTFSIRESLFVSREKARNILHAQQDRTDHTLRKRIFETQRARNELQWQKLKMQEEMSKTLKEIKNLEESFGDKTNALKLAETRLENRTERKGVENCLDEAYEKLCIEVNTIRSVCKTLEDQLAAAKLGYNLLEEHSQKIDADIPNKEHSLVTDIKSYDARAKLKPDDGSSSATVQTERNLKLTRMEDELPKN